LRFYSPDGSGLRAGKSDRSFGIPTILPRCFQIPLICQQEYTSLHWTLPNELSPLSEKLAIVDFQGKNQSYFMWPLIECELNLSACIWKMFIAFLVLLLIEASGCSYGLTLCCISFHRDSINVYYLFGRILESHQARRKGIEKGHT
jgi:hypothetical protein